MAEKPQKLIAVGMRFLNCKAAQDAIRNRVTVGAKVPVTLRRDTHNPNGVHGVAYEVRLDNTTVSYIRNKDVGGLEAFLSTKAYIPANDIRDIHGYSVVSTTDNYWILQNDLGVVTFPNVDSRSSDHYLDSQRYINDIINTPKPTQTSLKSQAINMKETKMNTNSMRDSFFREVKNVAIDIQSGKFGVISQDGISVYDAGTINVNPIQELGVKVPAFAVRVAVDQLAEGDIILNGADASFFKGKTENGYEVVTLAGEVKQVGQVSNMFFGKNTVLAVKNMFGNGSGMNPMMLAMLMSDDLGKGDNKNLMLAMAMSGGMGGSDMGGMNPLMLMMLMK